jgi:hypothetical protein
MWRVKLSNGRLSDIVNLSRAKDAAMAQAVTTLNRQERQETALGATPMRQNGRGYLTPALRPDQAAQSCDPAGG